jgi:hypothetical protein
MIIKEKDVQKVLVFTTFVGLIILGVVIYQTQQKKKDLLENKP